MLTQLQLEGPELEPLLARVRNELGASARIVHAEKIRSGGVAGFFAHQRFELTVEVDTSQPRLAARPAAPAAAVSAPATPVAAPAAAVQTAGAAATTTATAAAPAPAGSAGAPTHVDLALDRALDLDAAARAGRETPFSAIAGLQPGTGPDDAPSLFSSLAALSTPAAAPAAAAAATPTAGPARVPAPALAAASAYAPHADAPATIDLEAPTAPGPEPVQPAPATTGFAPHAAFAALVDGGTHVLPPAHPAASLLDLADRVSADEHAAVVSTEAPSFASLLSRLNDDLGVEPAEDDASGPVVLQAEPARVPAQRPASGAASSITSPSAASPSPASPSAVLAALAAAPADSAATAQADDAAAVALTRLGLPAHLHPAGGHGEQLHTALRASLTRLPTAPPAINRAGGVLAVVGPLAVAVAVAREIAHELGLPVATSVALATPGTATADVPQRQVLRATPEAAERRTAWRRRSNLTVVAVDAPLTATGAAEARAFLAALSPTATWGVVEATRKAQDVGAWTRALGGVHALALTDLEDTADPAAVLELGIPVSRLGGRPATPRAWATLLTGRLAA